MFQRGIDPALPMRSGTQAAGVANFIRTRDLTGEAIAHRARRWRKQTRPGSGA
jgi:hypothetical protein